MTVALKIPETGESITEVQIGNWRKSVGDHVERDEIVVEIETDKASMELPAPVSGTLHEIVKPNGATVNIGEVIAYISEADKATPGASAAGSAKKPPGAKKTPTPQTPWQAPRGSSPGEQPIADTKQRPRQNGKDAADSARGDDVPPQPRERTQPPSDKSTSRRGQETEGQAPAVGGQQLQSPDASRPERHVPMTLLRRRIAERLVRAQQTAALLTTFNEIDMTSVLRMRQDLGEFFQERHGAKLGFMSFFVKAAIDALKRVPQINAEVRERNIVYRDYFDIGVAVATDDGLVVPVLRDADRLSFAQIEKALADLALRARERKLTVDELLGGTFTISNGGVFGSLLSTPIVNPPQSGILGLHAIHDRPVARGGEVVIRPMMYVALTYDHRVVDGREAVTFLNHIKQLIETPARMLLET